MQKRRRVSVPPPHRTVQVRLRPRTLLERRGFRNSPVSLFSRTFPNCKFGDKCLFVHPSCKYDARCTKADCPFTHVSRRGATAAPPRPGTPPPLSENLLCFSSRSDPSVCVCSCAAAADLQRLPLLPRMQEDGLSVLPPEGKRRTAEERHDGGGGGGFNP